MKKIPVFFAIILSFFLFIACAKEKAVEEKPILTQDYELESAVLEGALSFPTAKITEVSAYYMTSLSDSYYLNTYTFASRKFKSIELPISSDSNISSFNVDIDGNSYFVFTEKEKEEFKKYLLKCDSKGKVIFKSEFNDSRFPLIANIIFTKDGEPAVAGSDMYAVINDNGTISKESVEEHFLDSTFLDFDWDAAGIDEKSVCEYYVKGQDEACAILYKDSVFTAVKIARKAERVQREKKLVIAACSDLQNVRKMARDYMKSQDEYDVVIKDYSQYDLDNAVMHLVSDILAGESIDLISLVPGANHSDMVKKGLYADLSEYISKSDKIKPDALFKSAYDMGLHGGVRYAIPSVFSVQTVATNDESLYNGIKTETVKSLINKGKGRELIKEEYELQFASILLMLRLDEFIDSDTRTADFNKDSFSEAAVIEKTIQGLRSEATEPMITETMIVGPDDLIHFLMHHGKDTKLVGYPATGGNFGVLFEGSGMYAVCDKSVNKDAAYDFVEYAYLESQREEHAMFVSDKAAFAKNLELAFSEDENHIDDDRDKATVVEEITEVIDNSKVLDDMDGIIVDIIFEELATYVNGDINVEDTINIINKRVNIYLQEKGSDN